MLHWYKTPRLLKKISPNLIWDIPTEEKEIYLTFDDGPIPHLTEYILDMLDEYEAKATFFCVGDNIAKYPKIFDSLQKSGHQVGNHTFNHLKGWQKPNQAYLDNIRKCETYISGKAGVMGKLLFRPPYGQITPGQIKMLKDTYNIVMWDVLAYDFEQTHTPQKSLEQVLSKTDSGSIVVFHDNYKAEKKLKYMLPRFLSHFKEKGYAFNKITL